MELRRVVTSLASRWWVLAIVGLIGALIAAVFVQQRNSNLEPLWRAETSISVPVPEEDGRPTGEIPDELSAALEIAQLANEDMVRLDTRFIEADAANGTLVFVALDRTEEAASAAADEMRDAYIAADPNFDADAELQALLDEATTIEETLEEIIPTTTTEAPPTAEEQAEMEAQATVLQVQQEALLAAMNEVAALKVDAETTSEINDYDEQLADYADQLFDVLLQLAPLQPEEPEETTTPPVEDGQEEVDPDLSIADQWTVQALESRLAALEEQSASLIVAGVTGEALDLPAPEAIDESPTAIPTWLALLAGFLAGALIGAAVLLVRDRVKGLVWHAADVTNLAVLAEPPAMALDSDELTELDRQRRKRGVQAIRSAIIGAGSLETGTVVGFAAPLSTDSHVLEDLAYDIATSLSSVGRSVLLVDLGFTAKSQRSRHSGAMGGLRDLFESVADDEETIRSRAEAVIGAADEVSPGLEVLVADPDIIEPADILAGRPLGELLEQARAQYDIVAVIQPTTGVGPGVVIDTHLQQQIIVCTRGRTTISEIAREAVPTTGVQNKVVGVVLVAPTTRRPTPVTIVRPAPARKAATRPEPVVQPVAEPEPVPEPEVVATPAPKPEREKVAAAKTVAPAAAKAEEPAIVEPEEPEPLAEEPEPVLAPAAQSKTAAAAPRRRPAERATPAPRRRRSSRSKQETSEAAAERLRALETYSVDESLYIKTPESPADSA